MQYCVVHMFCNGRAGHLRLLVDFEESVRKKGSNHPVVAEPDKVHDAVDVQTLDEVGSLNNLHLVAGSGVGSRRLDKVGHVEE